MDANLLIETLTVTDPDAAVSMITRVDMGTLNLMQHAAIKECRNSLMLNLGTGSYVHQVPSTRVRTPQPLPVGVSVLEARRAPTAVQPISRPRTRSQTQLQNGMGTDLLPTENHHNASRTFAARAAIRSAVDTVPVRAGPLPQDVDRSVPQLSREHIPSYRIS